MKAKLVPLYFNDPQDPDFVHQVAILNSLLEQEATLLVPQPLGDPLPHDADAVVFPQMLGDAYKRWKAIKAIDRPILVITSEFGSVSMWDWEINQYLASEGVRVLAPANLDQARGLCNALALKRRLKSSRFLVYQDNPGEGFQPEIFKRFYWWEKECVEHLEEKFGIQIVKKSYRELGEAARQITDGDASTAWSQIENRIPVSSLSRQAILSAVKLYMAIKREVDEDGQVLAAGINCLNESHFSDTTPCLAWNLLFEDQKIAWGCEADLVSMMTKVLIQHSLKAPFMMTNLYPFLMGMAALKHEHIPYFPSVDTEPENHLLLAHCGYFGIVPQSFSTEWTMREKVLTIVNDHAHALDARLPEGDVTLVKLMPPFDSISIVEGKLITYAQFENSDCRNGAVVRVANGHHLLKKLSSHHTIVTSGKNLPALEQMAQIFGLDCQLIS